MRFALNKVRLLVRICILGAHGSHQGFDNPLTAASSEHSSLKGSSNSASPAATPVVPETETIDELPTSERLVAAVELTELDNLLDVAAPKAVMAVLHPDTAQNVEAFVQASGTGYAKVWNIDQDRSLVVYSSRLEDWNAIAEVSTIKAPRQRSFWGRWRARLTGASAIITSSRL